jgi:transposase
MAYSNDLRKRVLRFIAQGGTKAEAAERFEIGIRTVFTWQAQGVDYQRVKPGPRGSRKFNRDDLAELIRQNPDALLKELAPKLGVKSINTISHALKCMGISRKKNTTIRAGF